MSHSTIDLSRDILPLRIACVVSVENPKLCKLAAHVWWNAWLFCGFPEYRIGSLCAQEDRTFLICSADLRPGSKFEAMPVAEGEGFPEPLDVSQSFELISNPLVFECILRGEPSRLKSFEEDVLRATVGREINALHYAAALGAIDCLDILIQRLGVKVDSKLLFCCDARFPFGDRQDMLTLLLNLGYLTLKEHRNDLQGLLNTAADFGASSMVSFLCCRFGDSFDLSDALINSCCEGHPDCCRLLIEFGADVNFQDILVGWTALIHASENGHVDCCRLLIDSGADVNLQDISGWTALMLSSENGHTDCCRLLIDSGVDVDLQDKSGCTALIYASENGYTDCCRLLIDSGADVNLQNEDGWTALVFAARNGHTDCCRLLLIDSGADVNLHTKYGLSALMDAAENGHTDCCRLLIDSGADANLQDEDGWTALVYAARNGHTDCCRLLIDSGADVNLPNEDGWTALMDAAETGQADCCRLLVESGADVNIQNEVGRTALMLASLNCHADCCRLLIDSGADANYAGHP